jgi:hypothetical protein
MWVPPVHLLFPLTGRQNRNLFQPPENLVKPPFPSNSLYPPDSTAEIKFQNMA